MKLRGDDFELSLKGTCIVDANGRCEIPLERPILVETGTVTNGTFEAATFFAFHFTLAVRLAMIKVIEDDEYHEFAFPGVPAKLRHHLLDFVVEGNHVTRLFIDGSITRRNRSFTYDIQLTRRPLYIGHKILYFLEKIQSKATKQRAELLEAATEYGDVVEVKKSLPDAPVLTKRGTHTREGSYAEANEDREIDLGWFKHEGCDVEDGDDWGVLMEFSSPRRMVVFFHVFLDGRVHPIAQYEYEDYLDVMTPSETGGDWRVRFVGYGGRRLPKETYKFRSTFFTFHKKEAAEKMFNAHRKYARTIERIWNHVMCRPGGPESIAAQARFDSSKNHT